MTSGRVVVGRGVSKQFGSQRAVADLDLDVPQGRCVGLLGPNGAGKTTTLRMVYGVSRPTAGSLRVFGLDVATEARDVRRRLGVTLQENVQIDVLSPEDNLRIFARYYLLREPELTRRVEELLDFLALRSHQHVPVAALSGGFRRRLAIAMSLLNQPELLILDEPTTGLDPAVRLALWSRVRELRENGTTVLLTTHYMEEAERLCDRVVIMSGGRRVCEGPPAQLIAEHLAAQTIELDLAPEAEEELLRGESWRRLRAGPRVFVYADHAQPVIDRVRDHDGGDRRPLVIRPTRLEDVFLATTGTRLGDGA